MSRTRGNRVTFNPDRIVMSGGATGAHEATAFCLADPGDAFLVPTPYYPGYVHSIQFQPLFFIFIFPIINIINYYFNLEDSEM